ncbi:uncharacterized protein LOC111079679 [Drosophila obscura]|uniref:uncharacterized protein LOC111079679 n=1 Tax=Drosophila obscura TaxID=7282 RepID=UPI001BB10047|nr:uncharacterized protein LOC111079679 [Drosophila obscura]
MAQRLDLANILRNQLNENREQGGGNLRLAPATKRERAALNRFKSNGHDPIENHFSQKPDVMKTIDNMVANIHSTMKATAPPRKAVPSIPAPIALIPEAPTQKQTSTSRNRSKSARSKSACSKSARRRMSSRSKSVTLSKSVSRFKGGGTVAAPNRGSSTGVVTSFKTKTLPIAAMKANLDQKVTLMMRRGLNDLGSGKTFTNQRRIREVLQQKVMLEQMLLQHRRLQRDRQTIALDIQRMREDLDRIRNKLDTSLQSLQATRTITGAAAKAKKPSTLKMVSMSATGRRPFSAASGGRRPFSAASSGRRLLSAAAAATAGYNVKATSPLTQASGIVQKRRMSVRSTTKRRGASTKA